MLGHENLDRTQNLTDEKVKMPVYGDDFFLRSKTFTFEKPDADVKARQPEEKKAAYEVTKYNRRWVGEKIRKLEEDDHKKREILRAESQKDNYELTHTQEGHSKQLTDILEPVEEVMAREQELVLVPANTVLMPGLAERFTDKLGTADRAKKRLVRNSELYQKAKNATMVEIARETSAKTRFTGMREAMNGREVVCENREEFRDLAMFVGGSIPGFTDEDKKKLLDSYLGKSKKGGVYGLYGQDRQLAMDIMTKAIMCIETDDITFESDASIARNALKLEAVSATVAAYERMLGKYNENMRRNAGDDAINKPGYLENLDGGLKNRITQKLDRLRAISFFYMNQRNIIRNSYYKNHLNAEISASARENSTNEQSTLAKALSTSIKMAQNLRQGQNAAEEDLSRQDQSRTLIENLDQMEYFSGEIGKEGYSSKAVMCNKSFKGLFMAFDTLSENGRYLWANSFRMRIIKNRIGEFRKLLDKSVNSFDLDPKFTLMRCLDQLIRACRDYKDVRINRRNVTPRHQSVLDILSYSKKCREFVAAMTDEQYRELTSSDRERSLREVLEGSDMVAESSKKEAQTTNREYVRMLHYGRIDQIIGGTKSGEFTSLNRQMKTIREQLGKLVENDEAAFNEARMELERQYRNAIAICESYSNDTPILSGAVKKYDTAREVADYSEKMLKLINRLRFSDIKTRNRHNMRWEDLIFGDELVIKKERKERDPIPEKDTTFTNVDAHFEQHRYNKALSFISGDSSMYRTYNPAVYIKNNGERIMGLIFGEPENSFKEEHEGQVFKYFSAEKILEASRKENISIVYSENALRQLSTIRIMDTLFGKTTRNMESISYNTATQLVFGEPKIVIRGVRIIAKGYLSQKSYITDGQEKSVSVLDEKGKLNIGAYDRQVADRIMSLTAQQCLEEFAEQKIEISEEEKQAFTTRFNTLKAAFAADKNEKTGWRYMQDEKDENKRKKDITKKRNELKQKKRWGVSDDSKEVKDLKVELLGLREKVVRDGDGLFVDDMMTRRDKGLNIGLIEESFLSVKSEVSYDLDLQKVNELEAHIEELDEKDKAIQEKDLERIKKILRIREARNRFVSRSEKNKMQSKNNIRKVIEDEMNKPEAGNVSEKFQSILETFFTYLKMDVGTLSSMTFGGEDNKTVFLSTSDFKQEGNIMSWVLTEATELRREIPKRTNDRAKLLEKEVLKKVIDYIEGLSKGKLKVPQSGNKIVVEDKYFCDIEIDSYTNKITYNGFTQMNDYRQAPLFAHEPSVNDISQGKLGDCYLLSTMAGIVERDPEFIKNMMVDNGDGTVTVRFYDEDGSKVYVTVEKTVPRDFKSKATYGTGDRYVSGALWIQMIEKAFVASGLMVKMGQYEKEDAASSDKDSLAVINELKKDGLVSYKCINGGRPSRLRYFVTGKGGVAKHFRTEVTFREQMGKMEMELNQRQADFLDKVRDMYKDGKKKYTLVVSSVDKHKGGEGTGYGTVSKMTRGVAPAHGYTVMGLEEVDGKEMLILRNPWGDGGDEQIYDKQSGQIINIEDDKLKNGGLLFLTPERFFNMFTDYSEIILQ